jgi:hypothetical protein
MTERQCGGDLRSPPHRPYWEENYSEAYWTTPRAFTMPAP